MTTASRGLVASMLKIASAQSANIGISIVRLKLLSLMLGPVGVGLLGIYSSLQTSVATFAGLGTEQSGVKNIAHARGDPEVVGQTSRVLLAGNCIQGAIAMALVWIFREPIALRLTGEIVHATQVGLVGVAVLAGMIASSQLAVLQGMRRIGDLAKVTVIGAAAGTVVGLLAVRAMGREGLIWFLIAQPLTSVVVAWFYLRRLPIPRTPGLGIRKSFAIWLPMAKLGSVFMIGTAIGAITLLLVRSLITRELGLHEAGLFAAAWGLTITYVGFLLNSMSADYFPRLTEVITDRTAASRLIDDQTQLGLAIGGPILLLLVGLAPFVMSLLYARAFVPASELLQWQSVGNVFKLASWPLGYALIAAGRSRLYLISETSWNVAFAGLVWVGMPLLGLKVAGIAFLIAYVLYLAMLRLVMRQVMDFHWSTMTICLIAGHSVLSLLLLALALNSPDAAALSGVLLSLITTLLGLRIIVSKIGPGGRLASALHKVLPTFGFLPGNRQ